MTHKVILIFSLIAIVLGIYLLFSPTSNSLSVICIGNRLGDFIDRPHYCSNEIPTIQTKPIEILLTYPPYQVILQVNTTEIKPTMIVYSQLPNIQYSITFYSLAQPIILDVNKVNYTHKSFNNRNYYIYYIEWKKVSIQPIEGQRYTFVFKASVSGYEDTKVATIIYTKSGISLDDESQITTTTTTVQSQQMTQEDIIKKLIGSSLLGGGVVNLFLAIRKYGYF
jgi:hypothetical protein